MIDSYGFGHMVIDKISYDKDLIVFGNQVKSNWWRKEGHKLQLEDIKNMLEETKPKVVVIGKGKFGMMRVSQEVKDYLNAHGIKFYAEPTEKATKIFNRLILTEGKVLGAFHLTC